MVLPNHINLIRPQFNALQPLFSGGSVVSAKRWYFTRFYFKCTEVAGSIVLFSGVVLAFVNILILLANEIFHTKHQMIGFGHGHGHSNEKNNFPHLNRIRVQLGEITALGLEILVVADIMDTLTQGIDDFTWSSLGKLAAIAAFRTGLAYALGAEVRELEEKDEAVSRRRW